MGKTPQRVVDLLRMEIPAKISRNQFCIKTGINQNSIDKYMAGITEPTQASLEKLANYFRVPVNWLRNDPNEKSTRRDAVEDSTLHMKVLCDTIALYKLIPKEYIYSVDYLSQLLLVDTSNIMTFHGPNIDKETEDDLHKLMITLDSLITSEWGDE